jgi:PleD family two-component response regulator
MTGCGEDLMMSTDASTTGTNGRAGAATQKVVIVNGTTDSLELLETVLESGHYDVVFVESSAHGYSQIKRVRPNLVILCTTLEDPDALRVLSMVKLDSETRDIPILTCTSDPAGQDSDEESTDLSDTEIFAPKPALRMN